MGKARFAAVAIALGALAAALLFSAGGQAVLYDTDTGRCLGRWPVEQGDVFAITFVHSVNKTPVRDEFLIDEGTICAHATTYRSFGAGVQSELREGETLTMNEDGSMTVSGFRMRFAELNYIVGTVSDHILEVDGQEISLRERCGRNAQVSLRLRGFL